MNRFLGLLFLFPLLLLMGCQLIIAETSGVLPQAALATTSPALASATPLTTTVAITAVAAPTIALPLTVAIAPVVTVVMTTTIPITTTAAVELDSAEVTSAGLQLYRQSYCGICHQLTAAGTKGAFGPPHDGIGAQAAQRLLEPTYRGAATTAAEYLYESLVEPQLYVVPGYELTPHRMPSYSFLTPRELTILVQWLSQQ